MATINWNEQQSKIINHREGNLIVSASAGSGKTAVMLERVLRIIEDGTPIDRIVILAFNNSIATEIRAKMYKKLSGRLNEKDCKNVEFIKEQIDRLPFCNIITNDSYCNRTSKEFFHILGIDPSADILPPVEGKILFKNSYNLALKSMKEQEDSQIFELILKFGGEDSLFNQVGIIHEYVSTQAGGMAWLDKVISGVYTDDINKSMAMTFLFDMVKVRLNHMIGLAEKMADILNSHKNTQEKANIYKEYTTFFEKLNTICNYADFYNWIIAFNLAKKPTQSKKVEIDWSSLASLNQDLKDNVSWLKTMFKRKPEIVSKVHKKTINDITLLVSLYKLTRANFEAVKRESGKYEFSDFTANLINLLNNSVIKKELASRYDYICVDEYQDTNYAQEEIYTNISNGNNLFMVGDSKQSIYRFRLSEPAILIDKFNAYEEKQAEGETIKLAYNYRSDNGIVKFVNAVFNEIMTKEFGGIDYEETDQLKYGADYKIPPEKPSYEIHIFEEKDNEEDKEQEVFTFDNIYSVKNDEPKEREVSASYKEGLFIARKIKEIIANYKVYDTEIEDVREVNFSDIALLAHSGNNNVKEIIKAIQDNLIPIDVAPLLKETGIYEVEIIKDIFRLVVNDMQDIPLTAVLTSYWVGMDYDQLLELREKSMQAEYFWQAVAEQTVTNNGYLDKLRTLLNNLRTKASYMTIKELATCIVYDYGFDKYVLSLDNGDYKLSAVKTYLATLSELTENCSLREYVQSLDNGKMEIKGGASGNVVKAMTIHKSKGLEFPVVFVCNIDEKINNTNGLNAPKLQINKDAGIAINYFDEEKMLSRQNLVFEILSEKNKQEEKAEAMRVFYVALTRPKNHIILTGVKRKKELEVKSPFKVNSYLDWIWAAGNNNPVLQESIVFHDDIEKNGTFMQRYSFSKYKGEDIAEIDKYLNFQYPHKKAVDTCIKYSVTEINKQGGYASEVILREDEEISSAENDVENKAKRGTNYHVILEHIDYGMQTIEEIESELSRLVDKGVLEPEDLAEIDRKEILEILNSPAINYARQNKYYREVEFAMQVKASDIIDTKVDDEVLVQGAIDLLVAGEEVWIVDFKKTDERTDILVDRYKTQLKLYSLAVEKAIGRKPDKAMLLIIGRNEQIEIKL